jgi:porin
MVATASAQEPEAGSKEDSQESPDQEKQEGPPDAPLGILSDSPDDPSTLLPAIEQRRTMKNSAIGLPGLEWLHETVDHAKDDLYGWTHLRLAAQFTHLFQFLSEAPLAPDSTWGTASDVDFLAAWELVDRGKPTLGQVYFQLEGRWEYGTTGPERLGVVGLGSLVGTANTFAAYVPTFLVRNLYWQQGTAEAGWAYRIGKITPDAMLSTSAHISSPMTFLPTAGTGPFSNALPDSGLGIAAAGHLYDLLRFMVIISDSNADRFNFGDIGAGDFYKAIELGVRVAPRTEKAGYSKVTLWHTDGTDDGEAANGNLGPEGWGFFIKYEMELADDGRPVIILRYGKSFNESAFYREQVGAHFVLYDVTPLKNLKNDLLGVAFNWAQSAAVSEARGEYNAEVFYRFPIIPQMDMTFSYQSVINPALDPDNGFASVFGIRFRTTF